MEDRPEPDEFGLAFAWLDFQTSAHTDLFQ